MTTAIVLTIAVALVFDYINGFHDAANSIATVVSTRVLTPGKAVIWAAFFNFIAAFVFGTGVAQTIGKGTVDITIVTLPVIFAGLTGAILWSLLTWWLALPTSSSHALIGGYAGAAVAKGGMGAVLCASCTELPGDVVRAIGACYVYIGEEQPLPVGLHERILQATSETALAREIRSSLSERLAAWLRMWLDPIISPQLATVATMLLVAVFVLTNTVSADGSISGVYSASVKLVQQSTPGSNGGIKQITKGIKEIVGGESQPLPAVPEQNGTQKPKQTGAAPKNKQNKP